jgi:hypothetical protein
MIFCINLKRLFSILIIFSISYSVIGQNFIKPNEWKKYKKEVFFSIGASSFLGDLGGRDQIGKDFSPADMDLAMTRTALSGGFRYKIQKWFNVTGTLSYLRLKGDDAETFEPVRNNRNLNFRSDVFETLLRTEFGYSSVRSTRRYSLKKSLSAMVHKRTWELFGYTGVGFIYFNPKGKAPDGKFVKLYNLHTEGQGLSGGPTQYKRITAVIPFGVYYKIVWDKKWSLSFDACWRKTFSDYIDDVGGRYYDPIALQNAYGPLSAQMADPSKGDVAGATKPDGAGLAAQRGDIEKDSYFTFQVGVGYIFKKQRKKKARLRSKF